MGPLKGLKILEFAGIGPGPFCGMMLADMGAEVLRIERPDETGNKSGKVDFYNMGKFDILNRNRRVLHINIKLPETRDLVHKLIRESDGLIEGFRPGVMEKLGLGPEECLSLNPRLVYGRMTGWGQEGPLSRLAGHDVNYIALNGVLDLIGNKGDKPAIPPTLVGDMGGGAMFLAFGMLAAILHASRTGEGQVVDAAIVDGSALLSSVVWSLRGLKSWGTRGTNVVDGGPHFYDTFECADGKHLSLGAIEPQFYQIILDKLGLMEDPDFAEQMNPAQWPEQKEKLAALLKSKPRDHWANLFEGTDACVWPVLSGEEALEHPHMKARETFIEKDGVVQPAPAPRFSKTPGAVRNMAGGQEECTENILKNWGLSEAEYSGLKNAGLPGKCVYPTPDRGEDHMSDYFSLSHILERLALVQGDSVATIYRERQQTWAELRDRVVRLAGGLAALGIGKQDIVAVLAENSDRYFEIYYTPAWIGAVLAPLNTRWSFKENLYAMRDSGAKILFFDDAFMAVTQQLKDNSDHAIEHFIYMGEEDCPPWALDYEVEISKSQPAVQVHTRGRDMAALMYTGGTTGTPKGVMLSHMGIWSSSISVAHDAKFREDDRYLHAAPMFHAADFGVSLATTISGATQVFVNRFTGQGVLDVISGQGITQVLLVPTMIKILLADEKLETTDVSSLRQLIYGASPMPEGVLLECMERLPRVELVQAYGQTELSPLATVLPASDHTPGNKRLRSAGRAGLCISLRIEDDEGNILPAGEVGQVMVHGPNVMLGYWNRPDITAATVKDGWLGTGDAGYLDTDGYLYLVDRIKDMIVSGGENVFSAEVESVISLHPAVADVAVIGIPDEEWGEAVQALIILKNGSTATENEIISHCKEYIAGFKCPRRVEFHTEPFPLSAAGKTLKTELRKPYWPEGKPHVN